MAGGRVGIREVAERAGVSPGTVSNTLNHPERVRPRTRETVLRAVEELGFVPSQTARVLGGAPSNVIALVMLDVMSPFYMELASATEKAARETGHVVMLCNSENDRAKEIQLLHMLASQSVRGAIVSPAAGADSVQARAAGSLPAVFLDHDGIREGCAVAVDDLAGGRLAVEHLVGLGHERIAFLGGPRGLRQMAARAQGMRAALEDAGLPFQQVNMASIGFGAGMAGARQLVADGLPSAVVCGNDSMAFGFYRALAEAGVRVPDDVALVGYDDIAFAAEWIVPLTSVRQPIQEMGRLAAQLLLEHSSGDPSHEHQQICLRPELIVRRSCGALG